MKQPSLTCLAACLFFAGISNAQEFNTNLIINPSFEEMTPTVDGPVILENGKEVDLVGWEESGTLAMDSYGGEFWDLYPFPEAGGVWALVGGAAQPLTSVEQVVDLGFAAGEIAAGNAYFNLSGWLGSYGRLGGVMNQDDITHLSATFRDQGGAVVGQVILDGPSDPNYVLKGMGFPLPGSFSSYTRVGGGIPTTATEAIIALHFERDPAASKGAFNNANADLLNFSISLAPYVVNFDQGTDGWTVINVPLDEFCAEPGDGEPDPHTYENSGGHPGGYFSYFEQTDGADIPFFRAGASPGDVSDAYGGFLRYERRIDNGTNPVTNIPTSDVFLQGRIEGEQVTLVGDSVGRPTIRWKASRIPLVPGAWRVGSCDGPHATGAELIGVLSDLVEIKINAEYRNGDEHNDIDNVIFIRPGVAPQSTFETDTDGWGIVNDAVLSWNDVPGEHPQCLFAEDKHLGEVYFFSAAPKFLGDQSMAFGKTVELDLWSETTLAKALEDGGAPSFLRLIGGGHIINYHKHLGSGADGGDQPIAGRLWRYHAVPLRPSAAWTHMADGSPVTESEFMAVLSSLDEFRIRGEHDFGMEYGRLDNVVFGSEAPSIVVETQGGFSATADAGETVGFNAITAGQAPLSLEWAIESPPDSYNYVALLSPIFVDSATGMTAEFQGLGSDSITMTVTAPGTHPGEVRIRAIATNAYGSYTSASVLVEVAGLPGDTNGDCIVDTADLGILINAFASSDTTADINGDGVVDTADLGILIAAFGDSCD